MSKLYNEYLKLKQKDENKLYLFKNGNFYIFLDKDCDLINEYIVLKKTKFSNACMKCVFPINSLNDYLKVFNNHKLNIEIIEKLEIDNDCLLDYINKIDINSTTPIEALIHLKKIKDLL